MYEVYEYLCRYNGVSTSDVCKATGIGYSTISNWKKRRNLLSPKYAKLIADYFGVTLEYLITGKDSEHPIPSGQDNEYYLDRETAELAQELHDNPEMRLLFSAAKGVKPETLRELHDMLLILKRREMRDDL